MHGDANSVDFFHCEERRMGCRDGVNKLVSRSGVNTTTDRICERWTRHTFGTQLKHSPSAIAGSNGTDFLEPVIAFQGFNPSRDFGERFSLLLRPMNSIQSKASLFFLSSIVSIITNSPPKLPFIIVSAQDPIPEVLSKRWLTSLICRRWHQLLLSNGLRADGG